MKKLTAFFLAFALCFSGIQLSAQEDAGTGARQSTLLASSGMSWGVGLVSLAALGTMAGLIASSATKSPVTFSHN